MSAKLEELLEEKLKEKINTLGFEIEYVENVNEAGQNIVRIVLDKENANISIDDCEMVSRGIEDEVDKLVKNEYVLEVSSPGLERQLKNIIESMKEIIGILKEVNEQNNSIKIQNENIELEVDISDISSAHTTYDYDVALKNNKVNLNELKKF